MNKVFAIILILVIVTAGVVVYGLSTIESNEVNITVTPAISLVSDIPEAYSGDAIALTVTLTNLSDRLVVFYCNETVIGNITTVSGTGTLFTVAPNVTEVSTMSYVARCSGDA